MTACSFKGCRHTARAKGLCAPHHRQLLRADGDMSALRPLRPTKQVRLGTVRVSEECAEKLEANGPTKTAAAKRVLEEWSADTARAVRGDVGGARTALDEWANAKHRDTASDVVKVVLLPGEVSVDGGKTWKQSDKKKGGRR